MGVCGENNERVIKFQMFQPTQPNEKEKLNTLYSTPNRIRGVLHVIIRETPILILFFKNF